MFTLLTLSYLIGIPITFFAYKKFCSVGISLAYAIFWPLVGIGWWVLKILAKLGWRL